MNTASRVAHHVDLCGLVMITEKLVFSLALLALAVPASQARAAMTIKGIPSGDINEPSYKYDRFYDQSEEPEGAPPKAFIGEAYDWSGVGIAWEASAGPVYRSRWVTMISPQYFLTAKHAYPPLGDVTFYETNSRTGPSHTYTIDTMVDDFGGTDLALGRLTAPIAPEDNIAHYPILDFTYSGLPGDQKYNTYKGLTFFASGHGGVHPNSDPVSKPRVGRNQIDVLGNEKVNHGTPQNPIYVTTYAMEYNYEGPPDGLGDDENLLKSGDSGGPSFVVFNDELALVGIHWYNNLAITPKISGDSFVPYYIEIPGSSNDITDYVAVETVTPLGGDANMDGIVNDIDATILAANWNTSGAVWTHGDFNADGLVNNTDATILASNWLQSVQTPDPIVSFSAVPEPATALLLLTGLASAAALHFRRRR